MADLPYRIVETLPIKAPLGKLPYIEDNGHKQADSRLIINYLIATYGDLLDAALTKEQRSLARAFQRLLEEHLYWAGMAARWQYTEANWQANKEAIFGTLPPVLKDVIAAAYRKKITGQIRGHGIGRLTLAQAFDLGKEDIDSLAYFLGDKPYFMGDQPTSLDASAYGILVNTLAGPIESPLKTHALSYANLFTYCDRMQVRYFPELPALTTA